MATKKSIRRRGTIRKLGWRYGFILDGQGRDRFFHADQVREVAFEDLRENDKVEFVPFTGRKGYRAETVRLIGF